MGSSNTHPLSTKTLVVASLFVGINIVLSRVGAIMLFGGSVRLSFGNIPLILSGLLLGPAAGFMTGIVSDVLGFLINSFGAAYHPGFTLSAGLTGFIPGLVMAWSIRKGKSRYSFVNVVTANLMIYILVAGLLNTWWLVHLLGTGFWVLFPARLISHGIITAVNIALTYPLLKSFQKANIIPETLLHT